MTALATLFITAVTIDVIVVNRMMIASVRCRMADMKAAFAMA